MGGSGNGGVVGGGGIQIKNEDCPRKFETAIIDIIPTGNASYAIRLKAGDKLNLEITSDKTAISLSHNSLKIGYLPPQRSNIIQCIEQGWKYSASIVSIMGDENNPQIRILAVGVPN